VAARRANQYVYKPAFAPTSTTTEPLGMKSHNSRGGAWSPYRRRKFLMPRNLNVERGAAREATSRIARRIMPTTSGHLLLVLSNASNSAENPRCVVISAK